MSSSGANEVKRELSGLLPRLWRFALYTTRDAAAAEDLVQSTCLRAIEKASQYTAGTRLDSWAFTIMSSIWKNELRARSRTRAQSETTADDAPIYGIDVIEMNVAARRVLKGVSELPDGQRDAVLLVYVEGRSYKEAAEILSVPIGTIMSRLATARKSLAHLNDGTVTSSVKEGGGSP